MPHSPGIKGGPGPSYLQEQQPPKALADAFNITAVAAPLPDHLSGERKVLQEQFEERTKKKTRLKVLEVDLYLLLS